ncbi:MAG TPA: molybdopterin cofactor-binding domain-containing protein [Gaiellaceae bacterium]|nr:molybdopterin cofactor-binding domain-containing protein [Gaiellaceae bacterium]
MTGLLHERELSRRQFLKGSGALVVGFSVLGAGVAGKASAATGYNPPVNQLDSWLTINPDNTCTFKTSQIECGNGATTGLVMLVAEELDLSPSQVHHSRWDTYDLVNSGSTGGSTSLQSSAGPPLRAAAATAKQALLALASAQLGVPAASLTVKEGVVSGGGRTVTYGELVGGKLFNKTISPATLNPGQGIAKPVSQYRIIGTRVPRVDIPDKISGRYTYVHNVRIPGMLHGRVVRPRGQGPFGTGAQIVSVDEGSIGNIPGARVVRRGDFLGVVAPHEYDAIQAAAQLKVTWKAYPPLFPGTGNIWGKMRADDSAGSAKAAFRANTGNVDAALKTAAKTISQTYRFHNGQRAVIGPSCAVADVRPGSAVIYSSSQQILGVVTEVASLLGLQPQQVRAYFYEGASSFGNALSRTEVAKAAALMSQIVAAPVRVQFMRWDENGWDNYQAAQLIDVRAGVDASGKLVAYDYTLMSEPYSTIIDVTDELTGRPYPTNMSAARIDDPSVGDAYTSPNTRLLGKTLDVYKGYFRTSSHRSGGEGQLSAFATEQAIDELAYAAGIDPVEFRRRNISDEVWLGALNAAAQAANWQPRVANSVKQTGNVRKGRGVALGSHGTAARSATVADVLVDMKTGKITVTTLYNGIDAGFTFNPALVENQMTGGSIMGVSRAIREELAFSKTQVTSLDWVTYPILRFKDAPRVVNAIAQHTDRLPLGAGEPPICPVPGAIANAFFDATGVRMREGPMTPARVRATLKAAGVA